MKMAIARTENLPVRKSDPRLENVLLDANVSARPRIKRQAARAPKIVVCRSLKAEGAKLFLATASLLLLFRIYLSYPGLLNWYPLFPIFTYEVGPILLLLVLIPVCLFSWALRCVWRERYTIGLDSVIREQREPLVRSRSTEMFYKNVNAIDIERNFYQQLMSIGSIRIGNLFSTDADIILDGIAEPEEIKRILECRVAAAIEYSSPSSQESHSYGVSRR
jgi:hypothetical protein